MRREGKGGEGRRTVEEEGYIQHTSLGCISASREGCNGRIEMWCICAWRPVAR